MGYTLVAFIAKPEVLEPQRAKSPLVRVIRLRQGFAMIPLDDELLDALVPSHDRRNGPGSFDGFSVYNEDVSNWAREISRDGMVCYVEIFSSGGPDGRCAIVWEHGKFVYGPVALDEWDDARCPFENLPTNVAFRMLGILSGDSDEFDALGLFLERRTDEWSEYEDYPAEADERDRLVRERP